MKEGVQAVKACCQALKSELAKKWRPKYNRSHIAFLASADGESLIANWVAEIEEKTEGGIIKPSESRYEESIATVVGWVMSMGSDAYASYGRFPSGPYCQVGDWVVFRAFSGTRIKIHGKEFRLINDDTVEAVVEDPRGVERA